MKRFFILFMVACLFSFATTSSHAADSCKTAVVKAKAALEAAEAENGDGRIEQCLPAKNPEQNTGKILEKISLAAKGFTGTFENVQSFDARLQKLKLVVKQQGACRAGPEWLKEKEALEKDLGNTSGTGLDGFRLLSEAKYAFRTQYSGRRAPGNVGVRPFRSGACRNTEQSVEKVLNLLQAAENECEHSRSPVFAASTLFEFWAQQRESRCSILQKCQKVSIGDDLYEVEYLDENGDWEGYARGYKEFEEAVKLVRECEQHGPSFQGRFPRDSGGDVVENGGDDPETGTKNAK